MLFWTRLKVLLRQPSIWLWTLVFPIALATFEYAAFGKLDEIQTIETIDISVVTETEYSLQQSLLSVLESAEIEEGTSLFKISYEESYDIAMDKFEEEEIALLLYAGKNGEVNINTLESDINTSITLSVIEQYNIVMGTISLIEPTQAEIGEISARVMTGLLAEYDYFKDESTSTNANVTTIYFYALIAMMCLYASFWGKQITEDISADRSALGIRINVAPTKKLKLLGVYYAVAMALQTVSSVIVFLYLNYVLKIKLGDDPLLVLLTFIVGSSTGISIGLFVSTLVKGSREKRTGILNGITLVLSALSGLMMVNIKEVVDKAIPFFRYINPAELVTDSLYALYNYSTYNAFILRISILAAMSVILVVASVIRMRGDKYESV